MTAFTPRLPESRPGAYLSLERRLSALPLTYYTETQNTISPATMYLRQPEGNKSALRCFYKLNHVFQTHQSGKGD